MHFSWANVLLKILFKNIGKIKWNSMKCFDMDLVRLWLVLSIHSTNKINGNRI